MEINGKVLKDGKFWLCEIPLLDLLVQSQSKKDMPEMVKDAVELLADDPKFSIKVTLKDSNVYISANNFKRLIALILKRLRLKNKLKLEDVAGQLEAKSINEYAQYEQAKHLPSIEKLDELLKAIDPKLDTIISLK